MFSSLRDLSEVEQAVCPASEDVIEKWYKNGMYQSFQSFQNLENSHFKDTKIRETDQSSSTSDLNLGKKVLEIQ